MAVSPLPIDVVLPDALRSLATSTRLVLEAPPGAGKTTRLPWAIAQADFCRGRVIVTEPRRIAASLAARRVADEQGQKLGGAVGYQVRFEDVTSKDTRVAYVTEGILLRRLAQDPNLRGVDCVVIDELHERSLDADLCLALVERLQRTTRPDLRLVAMSATLEGAHVASYLGDCPRLRSEGKTYEVEIRHAQGPDERPLEKQVRSAVREALAHEGDILVFLPGAGEIRRCQQALSEVLSDVEIVPLHGDLPIAEQQRAVSPGGSRRVVLSTNVAESSVTIPNVVTVIDSGLARVARHSPWSGLTSLELEEISQARAIQRAGRAGRTRAGVAIRLYTQGNFSARVKHEAPAIEREELSEALLLLSSLELAPKLDDGAAEAGLRFLSAPPQPSLRAALDVLEALGATTASRLTPLGRKLLDFPLHPRLARLIVEGQREGCFDDACLAAALLSDRDVRQAARTRFGGDVRAKTTTGDSDVEDMIERFREAADHRFDRASLDRLELDGGAVRRVERAYRQLARKSPRGEEAPPTRGPEVALGLCVLSAFSDRLAQRRGASSELVLSGGGTARLADTSVVHRAPLMVAVAADQPQGKRGQALVRVASRVEPEWLLDRYPERLSLEDSLAFDGERQRVERVSRMRFGRVVLDESRARAEPGPETAELLLKAARAKGLAGFDRDGLLGALSARLSVLRDECPELSIPESLADAETRSLELAAQEVTSLEELAAVDLGAHLLASLPQPLARALSEEAPTRLRLPGGREIKIHYEPGKGPWIESRLQDFFGMTTTPAICRGRLALTVHLLAPNQRAVQVTSDLDGFWTRHYPTIRKELMRRYPRHPWPEDGRTASPPAPKPPRPR